jgi:branched-chain amino acid transport system permease protein
MTGTAKGLIFWGSSALFVATAASATFVIGNEYPFFAGYVILQFVVLATAWNVLGGYAGYVNFGTNAFFGIGVYTAVFLFKSINAPLPLQIGVAAVLGAALGFGLGLLTLRMRGVFFSIATIAVAIIVETVIINWKYVGGASGIQYLRPAPTYPFDSYVKMLFVVQAVLVVIAVALARYIQGSWIGRGLQALRDDELAAECSGVPTLRLKLLACTVSGALMCAAGAPSAMYLSSADPTAAFDLKYSVSALAMSLIGGTAHWMGPILGALLLGSTQQILTVTISSELNVLVLGIMLVLFVVGAPDGLIGLWRRLRPPLPESGPVKSGSSPGEVRKGNAS